MSMTQQMQAFRHLRMAEVKEERRTLVEASELLARRLTLKREGVFGLLKLELHDRLRVLRDAYRHISVHQHPNQVLAELAVIQGQEKEALIQLGAYENLEDRKKDIDKRLADCNALIESMEQGGD
jgi:hypothetical protein